MSLADELTAPPPHGNKKTECAVIERAKQLSKADKTALLAAVDNPRWSTHQLSAVLGRHGAPLSRASIQRHRRGDCACYTTTTGAAK